MTPARTTIAVATSIPPTLMRRNAGQAIGYDYQRLCVQSWIDCGFRVLSVNAREEIAELAPHFPDVRFVATDRNSSVWTGRKNPYIADLLLALKDAPEPVVGIVNSDIVFEASPAWRTRLPSQVNGAIVIGQRYDTTSLLDGVLRRNQFGFDWFFFDKNLANEILLDAMPYAMGLPWWDYWLPIAATIKQRRILTVEAPRATHLVHDRGYSDVSDHAFAQVFARYVIKQCEVTPQNMPKNISGILSRCREIAGSDEITQDEELHRKITALSRQTRMQIRENIIRLDSGNSVSGFSDLMAANVFHRFEQRFSAGEAFERGMAFFSQGKWREAASEFRAAMAETPEDFDVLIHYGESVLQCGDIKAAYAAFCRALERQSSSLRALNDVGAALCAMGRFRDAISHFEKALALDPHYPVTNLAVALYKVSRSREALALLERALNRVPPDPRAIELYRRIADIDPMRDQENYRGIAF